MHGGVWLLTAALVLGSPAESLVVVDVVRLRVGDIVGTAQPPAAEVDLGPAPPPGGSRLLARSDIIDALRKAGIDPASLRIPHAVRVAGAARILEPVQVAHDAAPEVERRLPKGVRLVRVDASSRVTISPRAVIHAVRLAPVPRQKGPARISAGIDWACEDRVVATTNVVALVDVSAQAAAPEVPRGTPLTLIVEHSRVQVSTTGVTLADATIGDVVRTSVRSTGRVVMARVLSSDRALVVERP